jgi:hypothetical protein
MGCPGHGLGLPYTGLSIGWSGCGLFCQWAGLDMAGLSMRWDGHGVGLGCPGPVLEWVGLD